MAEQWTTAAVCEATGATLSGPARALTGVATDTRTLVPGELFVALRGENFDGHNFLEAAFAAGAAAALVSQPSALASGRTLLQVTDTLRAYGELARWWRRRHQALVIGVTGSTGKSSTKELIAAVLGQSRAVLASKANHNNEVGLPATLLGLTAAHEVAVLEMAMRGEGEIAYLARIAEPGIGVITNIGSSHLERLGSREAIARAKGELLEALGPDGTAVLNADDPHLPGQAPRHRGRTLTYGLREPADVRAGDLKLHGLEGSRFVLETPWGKARVRFGLPGQHMVSNALAAATAALAAGLTPAAAAAGLEAAQALPLRLEVVKLANGARVINDSYNAAPDSVRAGLQVLASEPVQGRRIACLGDMLELGDITETEHLGLGHDVAAVADVVVGVGPLGALIAAGARDQGHRAVREVADAAATGALLAELLQPGDLVLLKASRALGLERALTALERAT